MAYATSAHITQRFGTKRIAHLTGDGAGTTVDATILGRHIDDVSAIMAPYVRSYERKRGHTTPFDADNETLRSICANLVFYSLREADGILSEDELQAQKRFLVMLEKIASADIDLVDETENAAVSLADNKWVKPTRLFKRELGYS